MEAVCGTISPQEKIQTTTPPLGPFDLVTLLMQQQQEEQDRHTVQDDAVLVHALQAAQASDRVGRIGSHSTLQLWVPAGDVVVSQVVKELQRGEYGAFFAHLQSSSNITTTTSSRTNRPPVFVDGGSNLGLVTLLTALETNATIVAVEAASPTWIMQQFNLLCNLSPERLARCTPCGRPWATTTRTINDCTWSGGPNPPLPCGVGMNIIGGGDDVAAAASPCAFPCP